MLPKTILIVDDEEVVRRLIRLSLQGVEDADFLEASDAAEALDICKGYYGRIDLLLSDVMTWGKMSGAEMAAKLLKIHPETRIVIMSAHSIQALKMDADWHLIQKPFGASEIRETLRRALTECTEHQFRRAG